MKRKRGKQGRDNKFAKPTDAESAAIRRYRAELVEMLNEIHVRVGEARRG
jgi:hypothetical protein